MSKYIYEKPKKEEDSSLSHIRRSHQIIRGKKIAEEIFPRAFTSITLVKITKDQQLVKIIKDQQSREEISGQEKVNSLMVTKATLFSWARRHRKCSAFENGVRPYQHWRIHMETSSLQHAVCCVPSPFIYNREAMRENVLVEGKMFQGNMEQEK